VIETAARTPAAAPAVAGGVDWDRLLDGERMAVALSAAAVAALPLLSPAGPGNVAPVDLVMAMALSACLLWAGTSGRRLRFPYALPMGVLMAGGALGALVGPVPGSSLVALLQDVWLLAWCWALVNLASSPGTLRLLLATWAYSAVAWSVLLFTGLALGLPWLTGQTPSEGSRTALTFLDPSYSANYYVISIMVIWASGFPRHRGARVAAYAVLVAAIASTGSNSGVVALVAATCVAAVVGLYQRRGAATAIAALAFMALAGYALAASVSLEDIQTKAHGSPHAFLRDGLGRGHVSTAQRDWLLHESVGLYERGGPLGQGPASTKERLRVEMAPFVKEAHNDYSAALIERGALGLLGLFGLVLALGLRIPKLARARLADDFAAVAIRPHALVGAVAGTFAAMTVYELLHVRHVWALFGLVAALSLWGRR
jgi:hypothetical protein